MLYLGSYYYISVLYLSVYVSTHIHQLVSSLVHMYNMYYKL
jgi:hypothetical protein